MSWDVIFLKINTVDREFTEGHVKMRQTLGSREEVLQSIDCACGVKCPREGTREGAISFTCEDVFATEVYLDNDQSPKEVTFSIKLLDGTQPIGQPEHLVWQILARLCRQNGWRVLDTWSGWLLEFNEKGYLKTPLGEAA